MIELHIYKYVVEDGCKVAKVYLRKTCSESEAKKEIAKAKQIIWYAGSIIKKLLQG